MTPYRKRDAMEKYKKRTEEKHDAISARATDGRLMTRQGRPQGRTVPCDKGAVEIQ